ncbi:MAG: hypothetical protein K9J74_08545 [Sulfuritalea sp.]|nr:hypothetical protein [Sulfuritalea sp.]
MNISEHSFSTMQEAVEALLADITCFLNSTGYEYLVVGGWSPYLRNATAHKHPGTRDVDILFSDGGVKNKLHDVIRGLLDRGYKVSAKHDFQLLRAINVQGHQLVFNVDLLHPSESVRNPEMMVDHFDLGIKQSDLAEGKAVKSMVLPSSALLFYEGFSEPYELTTCDLAGAELSVSFPLLGHAGLILSKCESVKYEKRPRDAFDIFLAIESDTANQIRPLLRKHTHLSGVSRLIQSLREFANKAPHEDAAGFKQFDLNVYRYLELRNGDDPAPSETVLRLLADV